MAEAAERGARLATVGCGTSEHGAMAVAEQLTAALGGRAVVHSAAGVRGDARPVARRLHRDLARRRDGRDDRRHGERAARGGGGRPGHGGARRRRRGRRRPRARHARSATGRGATRSATCRRSWPERRWPAGSGRSSDPAAAERAISDAMDARPAIRSVAEGLHGVERFLTVGSGADRIAARELALKIEEGVRLPAAARDLETILHGHWVAVDERTAVVLLLTDARGGGARAARATQMLQAARAIGARTAALIVSPAAAEGLPVDAISCRQRRRARGRRTCRRRRRRCWRRRPRCSC